MRRALLVAGLAALLVTTVEAQGVEDAVWVRYPAISPDGQTVAFCFRGDVWLVDAAGGNERPLTTHQAYETRPVWSRDSKSIAFASDRHGNFDVFVVPAAGGPSTRLTEHSAHDMPSDFDAGDSRVLFSSTRQDAPGALLASSRRPELWSIPVTGGRAQQELTTPAQWARVIPGTSRVVYEDRDGYENDWRKHHTSPVTRDLWVWDRADGSHKQLTDWVEEDRNPTPLPEGRMAWLSERGGSFNVWLAGADLDFPAPLTEHAGSPVRFLSASDDGTLCYGFRGGVYLRGFAEDASRWLPIRPPASERRNDILVKSFRKGATEMAVSPNGDEIAFVVRGDVYVASIEHGTTVAVTATPEQERSVSWGPKGEVLYYAGERRFADSPRPSWNLYAARLKHPADERFFRATAFAETAVLAGPDEQFAPLVSPDGKQVAFLRNRDELAVFDVATSTSRTMIPADRNYSYADGDIRFSWSPDSKWLSVPFLPNKSWIEQIGVVEVATGRVLDVTQSGYYEVQPQWSPDGRSLLFISDRHGQRAHGSWGSDDDVLAVYLTRDAFDRARLPKEEFERLVESEEKSKKKGKKGHEKGKQDGDDAEEKDEPAPEVKIEESRIDKRLRRLTRHSSRIADYAITPDGESLLFFGRVDGKWDVWLSKPREGETRKLIRLGEDQAGELELSKDGKTLYVRRGDGRLAKADVGGALGGGKGRRGGGGGGGGGGNVELKPIGYAAEARIDLRAERRHLYEHIWRQAQQKFYDPALHGVDWDAIGASHAAALPDIENNYDFAELMSEMLGELNASHTGSGHRPKFPDGDATADLGLLYDTTWEQDGLRVAEVLRGGPADRADSKIAAGHVLTHIAGTALAADVNPWGLLNRKAGKRLRVTLRDASGASYDEVLRPVPPGRVRGLLYDRLIERRRAVVEQASGGRIGYVHVRSMNDTSFREVYKETLGRNADKEALVVDTRFNGGGWLHDDLVVFLNGKRYIDFQPRGKKLGALGSEPQFRWHRPSCVVMSEGNYSDAHMFPFAYREHGVGKLVGAPVAGTGTAVWWETLIDPTLYFGIPQVGMVDLKGEYLENQTLEPDVLVLTDPVKVAQGIDEQLLASVEALLDEIGR